MEFVLCLQLTGPFERPGHVVDLTTSDHKKNAFDMTCVWLLRHQEHQNQHRNISH